MEKNVQVMAGEELGLRMGVEVRVRYKYLEKISLEQDKKGNKVIGNSNINPTTNLLNLWTLD